MSQTHLRAALNHTSVRRGAVAENWNVISLASTPVHYYVTGTLDRVGTPLRSDSYPTPAYQLSSPKQNQFSGLEDGITACSNSVIKNIPLIPIATVGAPALQLWVNNFYGTGGLESRFAVCSNTDINIIPRFKMFNTYETVTKSARFDQSCTTATKGVDGLGAQSDS